MAPLIKAFSADDSYEDKPVKNGKYTLRVTSAQLKESSNNPKREGAKYIAMGFSIEGQEGAATVFHNLNIPLESDEPRTQRMMMRDIRRFYKAFGLTDDTELDEDDLASTLVGLTGEVQLVMEEVKDREGHATGEMRNAIRFPRVE